MLTGTVYRKIIFGRPRHRLGNEAEWTAFEEPREATHWWNSTNRLT
jgi:hypothetical protein